MVVRLVKRSLPRRNLFKVLEDNPAPELEDTPRGGDCSIGSTRPKAGSPGEGDPRSSPVVPAVASDTDTDPDPGTCTRPGIDIGMGMGIGIGIDIGIDIGIGIGTGGGPGVFVAEPAGLPAPCKWDDMYHQKPGFAVCLRVFNAFESS